MNAALPDKLLANPISDREALTPYAKGLVETACRNLVFAHIEETADLAASYARSLAEASWRGDQLTAETHLRQLRACVVAAIGSFKQLGGAGGDA